MKHSMILLSDASLCFRVTLRIALLPFVPEAVRSFHRLDPRKEMGVVLAADELAKNAVDLEHHLADPVPALEVRRRHPLEQRTQLVLRGGPAARVQLFAPQAVACL